MLYAQVAWITPSEQFSPAYGEGIARLVSEHHATRPSSPLDIVEIGSGNGTLAADILVQSTNSHHTLTYIVWPSAQAACVQIPGSSQSIYSASVRSLQCGAHMQNYLRQTNVELYKRCSYRSLEISPRLAEQQQQRLSSAGHSAQRFGVTNTDAMHATAWGAPPNHMTYVVMCEARLSALRLY